MVILKANSNLIQCAIGSLDWSKAFGIDVDRKVEIFNETIPNILRNFIPNRSLLLMIGNLNG